MARSTRQSSRTIADELFDKYVLPKAALVIIVAASFIGTAVSVRLNSYWALPITVLKWGYFLSLGVLTGGLLWKHGFVRPQDLDTEADVYCGRMYDRFDRIAAGSTVVLGVTSVLVLYQYVTTIQRTILVGGLAVILATFAGLALSRFAFYQTAQNTPVKKQFRDPIGVTALSLALSAVVLTATLEVVLRTGGPLTIGVRILHLLAFAVWVGGAVWNIFVAVPTGQEHPTPEVIHAAGQQLERFRWAVRFIIPTLALTGLYQAVDALGYGIGAYLSSLVGLAILTKLGSIGVLVVIFKLCPMWRACSPIDGICDLSEQDSRSDSTIPDERSPTEEPTDG